MFARLTEPLLPDQTNSNRCKYIIKRFKTIWVACSLVIIIIIVLCSNYGNLSYNSYNNFLNKWWPNKQVSDAAAALSIWASILLICNIIEGCMVKCSKYYQTQSHKWYSITSAVLFGYILTLLYLPRIASVLPLTLFYEFLGVQQFYSISPIFDVKEKCFLPRKYWFLLIRIGAFVGIIFLVILIILKETNVSQIIDTDSLSFAYSFCPICYNIIIFRLIHSFEDFSSVLPLVLNEYDTDIINDHIFESISRKYITIRACEYFIAATLIETILQNIFVIIQTPISWEQFMDFAINVTVLSLLSLVLYLEFPLFNRYVSCNQCSSPYLKSKHCEICAELANKPNQTVISSDQSISSNDLLSVPLQSIVAIIPSNYGSINSLPTESINLGSQSHELNCNIQNVNECGSFTRISMLSSEAVFVELSRNQFIETFNQTYGEHSNVAILNDYIHVIQEHDVTDINKRMKHCKCPHSSNRRNIINFDEEYIIELMWNIHCYIYHNVQRRFTESKKVKKSYHNEQKYQDDDHELLEQEESVHHDEDVISYRFGSFIYYNLLRPKYASIKEEMLHHITVNQWNGIYEAAQHLILTDQAKQLLSVNNHNNILKKQHIQIGDILAIKFYTDLDDLQQKFCGSFRRISDNDTDKDVITRHINKYYFWGKWLNHAITVYGKKINNNANISYYRGLSRKFTFSALTTDFNIPTSSTISFIAAQNFAGNEGTVLQLKCQYDYESKLNLSKALSVEWMSSFPDEKEVLFFGNFNQLMIANIYLMDDIDNNKQHKLLIETINNFERLCKGIELKTPYNNEQRARIMKTLIENEFELKEQFIDDYFAEIFHNICINRQNFDIKAFIIFHRNWPNVLEILSNVMDDDEYIYRNQWNISIVPIKNDTSKTCNNYNCKANASFLYMDDPFCAICANMISMVGEILINAKYCDAISQFDDVKMNAFRIESLQQQRLF